MSALPAVEDQVAAPVLEAVHVRKYFPIRATSFFTRAKTVQAVDDF